MTNGGKMKAAAVLIALCAVLLWVVWSHAPFRASEITPRRERIKIETETKRETPYEVLGRSRKDDFRILSDVRDAWTAPLVSELEVPIDLSAGAEIATAVAVQDAEGRQLSSVEPWIFEIRLRSGGEDELVAAAHVPLADASRAWHPLSARVPPRAGSKGRWVMVSRSAREHEEPAPALADARVCWSTPSVAGARPQRQNILIVSLDTLRADHLGCYGYPRATSPTFDGLAARGVLFELAISSAPWTLPSYASLFTSLHPIEHRAGVRSEFEANFGTDAPRPKNARAEALRPDVPTLAELLRDAGWRTAGFYNNSYLHSVRGVDRGFQEYVYYQFNARQGVDLTLQWIEAHQSAPWFVFMHLIDPHAPYAPPAPFDRKFSARSIEEIPDYPPMLHVLRADGASDELRQTMIDMYDGEIAYADDQVGRLLARLAELGELERTIIVLHSDHGEEFWEHGGCDHGHTVYNELLHVPLVIVDPKHLPQGRRVKTRVRALDVMPTLLDLAGLPGPDSLRGRSLVPLARGDAPDEPRECLSEALLWSDREIKSLMRGADKVIVSGSGDNRLFDIARDFGERTDEFAERRERGEALRAVLEEHHRRFADLRQDLPDPKITPTLQHQIKALGYPGPDDEEPPDDKPPAEDGTKPR